MTPLRMRMIEDMVSAGLVPATQAAYVQAVRGLAAHYRRSPDALSEAEVRSLPGPGNDERNPRLGVLQDDSRTLPWTRARARPEFSFEGQTLSSTLAFCLGLDDGA
jgi:hypothetical protein